MKRKKLFIWIGSVIGFFALAYVAFAWYVTWSIEQDLQELAVGLGELADGLSKLSFGSDSTSQVAQDSLQLTDSLSIDSID